MIAGVDAAKLCQALVVNQIHNHLWYLGSANISPELIRSICGVISTITYDEIDRFMKENVEDHGS